MRPTLAILTFAAALAGCGGSSSPSSGPTAPPPDGTTIQATPSLAFSPDTLTVLEGDTVTFSFGSVAHNVFFDTQGAPSDIPGTNSNVAVKRAFPVPGTYTYSCHIHPFMRGAVVVH